MAKTNFALTEEQIATALKQIETMLRDPTLEIESSVGIIRRPNYDTGCMEVERTGRSDVDADGARRWWDHRRIAGRIRMATDAGIAGFRRDD